MSGLIETDGGVFKRNTSSRKRAHFLLAACTYNNHSGRTEKGLLCSMLYVSLQTKLIVQKKRSRA
jgi:hypothetical protein